MKFIRSKSGNDSLQKNSDGLKNTYYYSNDKSIKSSAPLFISLSNIDNIWFWFMGIEFWFRILGCSQHAFARSDNCRFCFIGIMFWFCFINQEQLYTSFKMWFFAWNVLNKDSINKISILNIFWIFHIV